MCDGNEDCSDGSDEEDCVVEEPEYEEEESGDVECDERMMMCGVTGQCISLRWRCDGDLDCEDGSDEENCEVIVTRNMTQKCGSNEFQCIKGAGCVQYDWLCDGDADCADWSDEDTVNCDKFKPKIEACLPTQLTCTNSSQCIFADQLCDGTYDCKNGSDEENCDYVETTNSSKDECDKKCMNDVCLDESQVCDGKDDCTDGEDEEDCDSKELKPSCDIDNGGCDHLCSGTEDVQCGCHDGYKLQGSTCIGKITKYGCC